jgi:putative aminopeptidase FrvX
LKKAILEELCRAFGPTGRETAVAGIIKVHLENYGLDTQQDALGNIVARRGEEPYCVFCTHLDQPGWMVEHKDKEGVLHLKAVPSSAKLGEGWGVDDEGRRYRIFTDADTKSFRAEPLVENAGQMGTFLVPRVDFESTPQAYFATALGDRAGAAILIDTAASAKGDQSIAFVFYRNRYLGSAGITATLGSSKIKRLYILEPLACDREEVGFSQGKGPGVLLRTQRSVAPPLWVDEVTKKASGIGIRLQKGLLTDGMSTADVLSREGIPCLALGIPFRYLHSRIERAAVSDCDDLQKLLGGLIIREEDL